MSSILKILIPGSWAFLMLALACGVGLWLFVPGSRRSTTIWLSVVAIFYLLISLPWTAALLAGSLYRYEPLTRPEVARGATVIVILHGDHKASRIEEGLRVYAWLRPRLVVAVARGPEMQDALVASGLIPRSQLLWIHGSVTTRQQALEVARSLPAWHAARVVLVASPIHMPRALSSFRTAGVDAVPAISSRPDLELPRGLRRMVPQRQALELSYESLYEWLALSWYQVRGWA